MRGARRDRPGGGRRWVRRGLFILGVLVLAGLAGFAPRALRDVDAFRVTRVEVVGTRYLDPYAVVRAAGLAVESSVFDPIEAWRSGVLTLPLVEDIRVTRRLPGTVTLEVREVAAVALVNGPTLRPVDRTGRILEIDPAGASLDLPVLQGVETRRGRVDPQGQSALRALEVLRAESADLAERVSQVVVEGARLRVLFRDAELEALLPLEPARTQVAQLRLAYADLAARGELGRVRRIDVRFRDQVVVSFLPTGVS